MFSLTVTVNINVITWPVIIMPGVCLMVRVVGFGSLGPEFKSCSAVELIPGGVNSACHPSEVFPACWCTVLEW